MLYSELSAAAQSTTLMTAFALLALLLASLGLHVVLSYAITQCTNEIGVRMALGATSSEILLYFGKRGLALTLAGLVIGLAMAAIAARSMTNLLYGFQPHYGPTASAVAGIFLAVAAVACFVTAQRLRINLTSRRRPVELPRLIASGSFVLGCVGMPLCEPCWGQRPPTVSTTPA
jgi:ABC-type antimicrobial peptide transport system permease subunit